MIIKKPDPFRYMPDISRRSAFLSLIVFFAICCVCPLSTSAQATGVACNAGKQSQLPTNATLPSNTLIAYKYNVPTDGTVTSISILGRQAGGNVKLALYSEAPGGAPGSLLAGTTAKAMAVGVVSLDVSDIFISSGNYWIAVLSDNLCNSFRGGLGSVAVKDVSMVFSSSFPLSFGPSVGSSDLLLNVWLDITCCPTITGTTPNSRCGTGTVSLGANASAGTLNWYALPSGGSSLGAGTTFLTPSINTTTTYYVEAKDGLCASSRTAVTATVNNVTGQPGTISGNTLICSGSSNTYSISPVSGAASYSWTLPNGWTGTSTSTSITAVASSTGGDISVTANNSCGSSVARTLAITVNSAPSQPGTISGNTLVCLQISNTYSISPVTNATSYSWTLPNGWTGTSTSTSITAVAGSTSSTSGNIFVTANNSCGSSVVQLLAITVNASIPGQPGTISGSSTVCAGTSKTYTVSPVGSATSYTWTLPSGWTGTSATTSISVITGTSSGNISVVANNACGPSPARTLTIATDAAPPTMPGNISGPASVCDWTVANYTISPVSGATSYEWAAPNGWCCGSNTIAFNTGPSLGVSGNISVWAKNSCGASPEQTLAVTIKYSPAQPGNIGGNTLVCSGSSNTYSILPVSGATGYNWTLPGGWTGTSTSASITTLASSTSGDISVTAYNSCGPSPAQTLHVTVTTVIPVQPGTISGNTLICSGSLNTYSISPVSGATSYTWTLPNGWTGTSTSTSIMAVAGSTSGDISVIANNSCGSSSARASTITVTSAPSQPGTINGNILICSESSNAYSISPVSGATSYTWTLPNGWTGTSTSTSITAVAGSTSGDISVTANNSCGSFVARTSAITVTSIPSPPGAINGNILICSGSSNTYSISPVSGAASYTWTLPNGWTGTSTSTSITAVASSASGDISVMANNSCGSSAARTLAITVTSAPSQPGAINGNILICSPGSNTYSISPVSGATSYTWTLPNGWTGTSTSTSITAVASSASGAIAVMANNSCGSSVARTLAITVTSVPSQPGTINGNILICSGSSNTYSISPVGGATSYEWTLPNEWTGTSTSTSITTVSSSTSGDISVKAYGFCGPSATHTLPVIVNTFIPVQPGTISGKTLICSGASNTYSISLVSGATSYTWTLPNGWSGTSTSTSITAVAGATSGEISVRANSSCGSSVARILTITVNDVPTLPGAISGKALVCSGSSNTYSISPVSGATSYAWTLPNGWTGTSTSVSITAVTSSASGDISVTANNSCGSSAVRKFVNVTSVSKPVITVGSANPLEVTLVANGEATSYQWYDKGVEIPGAVNSTYTVSKTGIYTVQTKVNDCVSEMSDAHVLVVTSVEESSDKIFSLYPNPASTSLFVSLHQFKTGEDVTILVTDMAGNVIQKINGIGDTDKEINIHSFSPGTYLVIIQQQEQKKLARFVKANQN